MTTYEYAILIGRDQAGSVGGVTWYMNGIGNPLGEELVAMLNRLGGKDGRWPGSATSGSTRGRRSS
jgi:hypothetical protein